jgi:hypothetical protein
MIGDVRSYLCKVLVVALALVGLVAAPAAADPAGPSDFRSEVTGIAPAVDGVRAEIRGGDAFLEIEVEAGHEVTVFDYTPDKPYLRVLADGTVQRNRTASGTYLNDDRKGGGTIPESAEDPDAEPDWEDVGDGGTYAWHDHRVHWMTEASPPVARGERVGDVYDPWRVPILVDGTAADIEGTLVYENAPSPIPWAVLALITGGLLAWGGRRNAVRTASVGLVAVAALGVVVGRGDYSSTPDSGGNPLLWILPVAGLVLAAIALARSRSGSAVVFALGSVASLSGWALLRIAVLTKPVLPTELPAALDRSSVAAAIGVSIAAAYLAVTSGALAFPDLVDDDPSDGPTASRSS